MLRAISSLKLDHSEATLAPKLAVSGGMDPLDFEKHDVLLGGVFTWSFLSLCASHFARSPPLRPSFLGSLYIIPHDQLDTAA